MPPLNSNTTGVSFCTCVSYFFYLLEWQRIQNKEMMGKMTNVTKIVEK